MNEWEYSPSKERVLQILRKSPYVFALGVLGYFFFIFFEADAVKSWRESVDLAMKESSLAPGSRTSAAVDRPCTAEERARYPECVQMRRYNAKMNTLGIFRQHITLFLNKDSAIVGIEPKPRQD